MYSYIIGEIRQIETSYIVLENENIGYLVYTANPYKFKIDTRYKIYIYQYVREDEISLYGFETKEEKELFQKLILVKGIGCKTAIGILATGEIDAIIDAIEGKNTAYLKKIPGIGPKAAQQIILDLHGKFDKRAMKPLGSPDYEEATEVLIALGYKQNDVEKAMKVLSSENLDTNGYVKRALALLTQ